MEDADAEIEAIQNRISGEENANEKKPDGVKIGKVHGRELVRVKLDGLSAGLF
jgi:hypothetical protein